MTDNKVSYQRVDLEKGSNEDIPKTFSEKHFGAWQCEGRKGTETEKSRSRVGGYPHKHRLIPFHSECAVQICTSRERPTAESFQEQSSESKDPKILSEVLSSLSDLWIKALFSDLSSDGEGEGWGGMGASLNHWIMAKTLSQEPTSLSPHASPSW